MKNRAAAFAAILALALGLVLGAAFQNSRLKSSSDGPQATAERLYAMNVAISGMPFWNEPKQIWERIGSASPGVKTLFGGPATSDPSKQIEDVEAVLSKRPNGLVVFSTDPNALVATIDKAVDSGVPVVTVFADLPKSKRLAYVGANQVESAKAVARLAMRDFPDRVQVQSKALIVVGKIGAEDQDDRRKGFESEIGNRMQVVTPVVDDYKADQATAVIRAALTRHPEIKFIFGCNSQSAIGAIAALKELGKKPGDVVVTAWDSETVVLNEIKASGAGAPGWVHATSVLYAGYMVQTAFSLLEAAHFGYLYAPGPKGGARPRVLTAPRTVDIPMRIVTASNIDEFLAGQPATATESSR